MFSVYDLVAARFLSDEEMRSLAAEMDLDAVPIVEQGEAFAHDQEALLALADGVYPGTNPREGIVNRPRAEVFSRTLNGRLSFKAISNRYLLGQHRLSAMRRAKVALVLLVATVLAVAWRTGVLRQFADPASVKTTLLALGPWGYVVYVLSYAALQPFGVPGTVFIMAAPLIWPWPVAFACSPCWGPCRPAWWASPSRASSPATGSLPASRSASRRYDEALARRAFATVFTLRLIFWMPPLLHAFFGVSKVRFATHFWGSLFGYVIPLLAVSFGAAALRTSSGCRPRGGSPWA